MGFLTPWFLGGLALLGVPLLIHLTRRDRATPLLFPSLMFLRRLPQPTTARRRLRDLPLLLLRLLALVLLAMAFARPLLDRARAAVAVGPGGRALIILVDRSASMGADDRWSRAQAATRRALDGAGPNDQVTLAYFDAVPTVVGGEGRAALRAAVDTARVGAGTARYAPALALAARVLGASAQPRREALLVSDFQRSGWRDATDARLPNGATLTSVDVGEGATADVGVVGVDLRHEESAGGTVSGRVVARLVASGGAPRTIPVTLAIGGRTVRSARAAIVPGQPTSVAFDPVPLPPGWAEATVQLPADALAANDTHRFVAAREQALRVLLVDGPARRDDAGLYLRRALAVGDTPPFRVDVVTRDALRTADLAGHALVILHDAPVRGQIARDLAAYVQRGGGLLIATGEASAPEAWDASLAALLPARSGAVEDQSNVGGTRLAALERGHPVFVPFADPHSGDLTTARTLRRRALRPIADATVLARFDDGAPALVERTIGEGRVLMWASTLDGWWTDLALQPVFVPLVHQLVTYTAHFAPPPPAYVVGQSVDPARLAGLGGSAWIAEAPSGQRLRLASGVGASVLALQEAGVYRVRPVDAAPERAVPLAANVDASESDAARIDPSVIARAVVDTTRLPTRAIATAPVETRAEREARQGFWWYLLGAALVLLAMETLLSNRRAALAR